jgi:hypothetical protein
LPISHQVDPQRRRVYSTVEGRVQLSEMIAMTEAVVADPDFRPGFSILSDHRRIEMPATPQQMQGLLEQLHKLSSRLGAGRWAVVTLKAASYGMMQMLRTLVPYRTGMEMEVFTTLEDAERWLDSAADGTE